MAESSNKTEPQRPEQQQIDDWLKSSQWSIDKIWNSFHNGSYEAEGIPIQMMYTSLANAHAELARVQCLNGEPHKVFRGSFSKAAGYTIKSFKMAYDQTDPDYIGDKELPDVSFSAYGYVNWQSVSEPEFIKGIYYALMGADFEIARELAQLFRNPGDGVLCGKQTNRYAHALKFAVMGEKDAGKKLLKQTLNELESAELSLPDILELSENRPLYAILDNDEALFHRDEEPWLEFAFKQWHLVDFLPAFSDRNKEKGTKPTDFFGEDYAVALVNLAIYYDMKVKIDHLNLPKDLILQPEG